MMPKGKPSVKLGQCYLPGGYLVPELWRDEIQKSLKATHLKVSFEFVWILSGAFLGFLPWRPANFLNASQVRYYQVPKEALRKETSSLNKLLTYLKIFGFQKKTYSKIEGAMEILTLYTFFNQLQDSRPFKISCNGIVHGPFFQSHQCSGMYDAAVQSQKKFE